MHRVLQLGGLGGVGGSGPPARVALFHDTLHAVEELGYGRDALFGERSALGVGEREAQVHPEHVRTVHGHVVVGVDYVAAGLAHALAVGAENDALVDQTQERLVEMQVAHVAQRLCDEARVEQVHAGVFRAAHVGIDGQYLIRPRGVERLFVVVCVGVAQVVPARAHERVQGVGVALGVRSAHGAFDVYVAGLGRERAFAGGLEVHVVRQFHGQVLFGYGHDAAVRAVYDGYGRAPIALTRYRPVAQAVGYLRPALAQLGQTREYGLFCLFGKHAGSEARVHRDAVSRERQIVGGAVRALDHAFDGQAVLGRELEVAVVVSGHGHDRARAVSRQHVVGHPHGDLAAVYRVDGVRAREHARLFLDGAGAVDLRLTRRL